MSRGMRGYTGNSVPTNRVIRSRSHVMVRTVPKYTPTSKGKVFDYEFSLTQLERETRIKALIKFMSESNQTQVLEA